VGPIGSGTDLHAALIALQGAPVTGAVTEIGLTGSGGPYSRSQLLFVDGTNVTMDLTDDPGNDRVIIEINSSGGDGSTAVKFVTGAFRLMDANSDAKIDLDGGVYISAGTGWDMVLTTDDGPIVFQGPGGVTLPDHGSDPGSPTAGEVFFQSTTQRLRMWQSSIGQWVDTEWVSARGTATIASGNTSITVTPGISYDPGTARQIIVWPINNPTNDPGWFWVSNVGSNTFQINVRANPGASGAIFGWRIVSS
jgi:hypothetical protein